MQQHNINNIKTTTAAAKTIKKSWQQTGCKWPEERKAKSMNRLRSL